MNPENPVPIDSGAARCTIEHIMNKSAKLAELRHSLARYGLPPERKPLPTGHPQADAVLGGGLRPGSLHEVFAKGWCAGGFAALHFGLEYPQRAHSLTVAGAGYGAEKQFEEYFRSVSNEVAAQFEAILVRQLLAPTMTAMLGKESGAAGSVYGDMLTNTLSEQLTRGGGGLGLSRLLEQQLTPRGAAVPAKHLSP